MAHDLPALGPLCSTTNQNPGLFVLLDANDFFFLHRLLKFIMKITSAER